MRWFPQISSYGCFLSDWIVSPAQQYVPLFLAKEDLDVAVQSAYKQRNSTQIKIYRDKANKFDEEYNQVG